MECDQFIINKLGDLEKNYDGRNRNNNDFQDQNENNSQNERMRRKMLMRKIESNSYFNLNSIRDTIKDINEQKAFKQMQKDDTTLVLNPVFLSVQAVIGKKKAQEVKTYDGSEIVQLNSQLYDIPLMDKEVESHNHFQSIIKNNSELLEPNKYNEKIKKIDEKIYGKQRFNIQIEDQQNSPQILIPPAKPLKKKQEKQSSIMNRIMRKEKALLKEQLEIQYNLQKEQLKEMKKEHIIQYENKLRELKLKQIQEALSKKCSYSSQVSGIIKQSNVPSKILQSPTRSPTRSPTNRKQNLLIENFPTHKNEEQQRGESPSQNEDQQNAVYYITEPKPNKLSHKSQSVSNTPIQRQDQMKKTIIKLNSEYKRQDSKENQKIDNQPNMNIITDFSSTLSNLKKYSSMYQYGSQGAALSKKPDLERNQINEKNSRSSSVQTLLESFNNSKQENEQRGGNQNKVQYQNESDTNYQNSLKNNQEQDGIDNNYQNSQIPRGSMIETNQLEDMVEQPQKLKDKKQKKADLDDSLQAHIQNLRIRDTRLKLVKKKLGLLDQETIKQEQIQLIQKSLEQLQKDQEDDKKKKNKKFRSTLNSNSSSQRMLTFSHNIQYDKLKQELKKQKENMLMMDDQRNQMRSNSSSRIKTNRTSVENEYLNINNINDYEIQKNNLTSSKSHRRLTNQSINQIGQKTVQVYKKDEVQSQRSSSPSGSLLRKQTKYQTQFNDVFQIRNSNSNQQQQQKFSLNLDKVINQQNQQIHGNQIQGSFHLKRHFLNTQNDERGYKTERSFGSENKIFTVNQIGGNIQQKQNAIGGQSLIYNQKNQNLPHQVQSSVQNFSTIITLNKKTLSNDKFENRKNNTNQTQSTQVYYSNEQIMRNSSYEQGNSLKENGKQLNNSRNKLFSNHVNKSNNKNLSDQYHHSLYSQQTNQQNQSSFQSFSNFSNSLIQVKQNMKIYFKERIKLKKEFGEKITEADKNTYFCKEKVNNFVDGLIDYTDDNKIQSRIVHEQMKQNFSNISNHLLNWKKELLDDNSNFENNLVEETLNYNKHQSQANLPV